MTKTAYDLLLESRRGHSDLDYFEFEYSKYTFYYAGPHFGYIHETLVPDECELTWNSFEEMLDSRIDEFGKTMGEALRELPTDAIYIAGVTPAPKRTLSPEERLAFFDDVKTKYRQETATILNSLKNSLEVTIKGAPYLFRYCPPGTFLMGSPEDEPRRGDDEYLHKTTLTRGFWILETPVTQALWRSVMGTNPSDEKGDDLPVTCITLNDSQRFVRCLNAEGYAPKNLRFSLPTEAEWEYACRAGTTTPFSFGDVLNGYRANCNGRFPYTAEKSGCGVNVGEPTPVKIYPPNPWGLYDMHGNIWEWTLDGWSEYPNGHVVDPFVPQGRFRIARGGSWRVPAECCRSADRRTNPLECWVGCRVVLLEEDGTLPLGDRDFFLVGDDLT